MKENVEVGTRFAQVPTGAGACYRHSSLGYTVDGSTVASGVRRSLRLAAVWESPEQGWGVETRPGELITGQMSIDVEELVEDISLAMRDENAGFAMFIDEMQKVGCKTISGPIETG